MILSPNGRYYRTNEWYYRLVDNIILRRMISLKNRCHRNVSPFAGGKYFVRSFPRSQNITHLYTYVTAPKQHNNKSTPNVASTSAGNCSSAEQCVNDSSYPDGQCDFPSHHTLAFTQASNSGHLNSQSAVKARQRQKIVSVTCGYIGG